MWFYLRLSFSLLLVSLIVSLTVAQGWMRGPAEFGQNTIVICTGNGLGVVTLDHNGEPLEATPECPDTSVVSLADGATALILAPQQVTATEFVPLVPFLLTIRLYARHNARAPPSVV